MSAVESLADYGLSQNATKASLFSKIGIVGCGKEGQNIARMAAVNGLEVSFIELSQDKIDAAISAIDKQLDTRIENWGLTKSEKRAIMGRISGCTTYDVLADCDFVIEAVLREQLTPIDSISLRKSIFEAIEAVVSDDCIIGTNATTVIVSEISSNLKNKKRCVSLNFFINSPDARVVEVVKGLWTSDEVYDKVCNFLSMLRRQVIPVNESVGLIGVRLMVTMINEACDIYMEGVASLEDIDKIMNVGYGMRIGLFQLADTIGLDKIERWGENLFDEFGKPQHKPSPIIKRLVRAKQTGVSAGSGFYTYDANGKMTGTALKRIDE